MEKRMIGAIALCFLAYILFMYLYPPAKPDETAAPAKAPAAVTQTAEPSPVAAAVTAPATPEAQPAAQGAPAAAAPAVAPAPAAAPLIPAVPDTVAAARKIQLADPLFDLSIDNRGAVIEHFTLKRYKDGGKNVDLILDPSFQKEKMAPAERFLGLSFPEGAVENRVSYALNAEPYTVTEEDKPRPHPVTGASEPCRTVVLALTRSGVTARKEISVWKESYVLRLKTSVTRGTTPVPHYVRLGPGLTNLDLIPSDPSQLPPHAVFYLGDSAHPVLGEAIGRFKRQTGQISWAGVQNKYFAAVAIPAAPFGEVLLENRVVSFKQKETEEAKPVHLVTTLVPGGDTFLFLGPKAYDVLSGIRGDLAQTIDYGMFSFIVKPLYYVMKYLQAYIPNMGLCLITLTLVITLALFPLRFHQMRSMKKMQVIQPQMKAIQAKYRGKKSAQDRQNMNQEMMALYKEAGVNPMGGCLPLLAQLPFLFAFYNLVSQSIEFWRQPFVLWIRDLSMADPTWITPILMGASMIIQMKQTPQAPGQDNRTQKMMMYVMPVIMTFMFISLSSGLVIYFLFSNVFAWGMQVISDKFMKTPKVELASAPAGRPRKTR